MASLIAILISVALFAGFVALTLIEKKRGVRVLSGARSQLDAEAARASFILSNTDFAGALLRLARMLIAHIAHDVTAMTLRAIRMLERGLATLHVRLRRARRTDAGNGSHFVKSISYYKRSLRNPGETAENPTSAVE